MMIETTQTNPTTDGGSTYNHAFKSLTDEHPRLTDSGSTPDQAVVSANNLDQ